MPDHSLSVLSRNYVFDPRPRFPLRIAAKRYWIEDAERFLDVDDHVFSKAREDSLTPVFLHGIGAHKEHWEPTVQRLFVYQQSPTRRAGAVRFHDMWSIDMPNQGDSAILNEDVLRWGYETFSWEHQARGIHAFLAGLGTGVDVDFSKRKLVLVGHSAAGSVSLLVTTFYPLLKFSSLHLIEPSLVGKQAPDGGAGLAPIVEKRRDIWANSEEVFRTLRSRPTLHLWDERVLKILSKHGVRSLPTAEYPDLKEGVTLKCTKRQEAATFRDRVSYTIAYRYLPYVLKQIPTHITYGSVMDLIPVEWQEETLYVASGGISNFASVTRVPGAGHMIVQTHPDVVGDVIWKSLTESYKGPSKLGVSTKL